jgi:hypothetical protein
LSRIKDKIGASSNLGGIAIGGTGAVSGGLSSSLGNRINGLPAKITELKETIKGM